MNRFRLVIAMISLSLGIVAGGVAVESITPMAAAIPVVDEAPEADATLYGCHLNYTYSGPYAIVTKVTSTCTGWSPGGFVLHMVRARCSPGGQTVSGGVWKGAFQTSAVSIASCPNAVALYSASIAYST